MRKSIGKGLLHFFVRKNLCYNYYVGSLRSAVALCHVESNRLTLFQSLEAISYDSGEMYEYILASLRVGDEAVALSSVEPLYCTLVHGMNLL